MEEYERKLTRHMLLYFLDKRGFELDFDTDSSEFSFVLSNQEFYTKEMTSKELLEVIDQVVRW